MLAGVDEACELTAVTILLKQDVYKQGVISIVRAAARGELAGVDGVGWCT